MGLFRIREETQKTSLDPDSLLEKKRIRLIVSTIDKYHLKFFNGHTEFQNRDEFVSVVKKASKKMLTMFGESYLRIYPSKMWIVAPETFSGDDTDDWFEKIAEFEYF